MTISENESIAPVAGGDDERMLRAQRVLDLVSRNERARADLVAAYDGPGDALEALRRAADPGTAAADRLVIEQLRKLAFGRTTTDAEHQAAADALGRLRDLESIPDDVDAALDRALTVLATTHQPAQAGYQPAGASQGGSGGDGIFDFATAGHDSSGAGSGASSSAGAGFGDPIGAVSGDPSDSLQAAHTAPAPHRHQRGRRRLVTAGVLAATLLCGGLAGIGLTRLFTDASASASTPGDLAAANAWFDSEQTPEDELPSSLGDAVDLSTSRLVHEAGSHTIWLALAADEGVCLISSEEAGTSTSYAVACADQAQFEASGVALVDRLTEANWDGTTLTVAVSGPPTG